MIPKRAKLSSHKQYAKIGERIKIYPLLGGLPGCSSKPWTGVVTDVKKNKYGRISYYVDGKFVITEELTPDLHKRCGP